MLCSAKERHLEEEHKVTADRMFSDSTHNCHLLSGSYKCPDDWHLMYKWIMLLFFSCRSNLIHNYSSISCSTLKKKHQCTALKYLIFSWIVIIWICVNLTGFFVLFYVKTELLRQVQSNLCSRHKRCVSPSLSDFNCQSCLNLDKCYR